MVMIIKKGGDVSAIKSSLADLKGKKGFDSNKHKGVVALNESPVSIQKKLRDEWQ